MFFIFHFHFEHSHVRLIWAMPNGKLGMKPQRSVLVRRFPLSAKRKFAPSDAFFDVRDDVRHAPISPHTIPLYPAQLSFTAATAAAKKKICITGNKQQTTAMTMTTKPTEPTDPTDRRRQQRRQRDRHHHRYCHRRHHRGLGRTKIPSAPRGTPWNQGPVGPKAH